MQRNRRYTVGFKTDDFGRTSAVTVEDLSLPADGGRVVAVCRTEAVAAQVRDALELVRGDRDDFTEMLEGWRCKPEPEQQNLMPEPPSGVRCPDGSLHDHDGELTFGFEWTCSKCGYVHEVPF
jgi:hypothetical protein